MIVCLRGVDIEALCMYNKVFIFNFFQRVLDVVYSCSFTIGSCTPQSRSCARFWWTKEHSKELYKMWADFILLIETLEETQVLFV